MTNSRLDVTRQYEAARARLDELHTEVLDYADYCLIINALDMQAEAIGRQEEHLDVQTGNNVNLVKELERLRKELNAAKRDLLITQDCRVCANKTSWCDTNPDACKGWRWRVLGDGEGKG